MEGTRADSGGDSVLCIVWDGPQALSLHSQDPGQNHREGMGLPGKWRCQRGHGLGAEIGVSTQGMRNFGPILPERVRMGTLAPREKGEE